MIVAQQSVEVLAATLAAANTLCKSVATATGKSKEEIVRAAIRKELGDPEAVSLLQLGQAVKEELAIRFQKMARTLTLKYKNEMEQSELEAEAQVALVRALNGYSSEASCFTLYLKQTIRNELKRYVCSNPRFGFASRSSEFLKLRSLLLEALHNLKQDYSGVSVSEVAEYIRTKKGDTILDLENKLEGIMQSVVTASDAGIDLLCVRQTKRQSSSTFLYDANEDVRLTCEAIDWFEQLGLKGNEIRLFLCKLQGFSDNDIAAMERLGVREVRKSIRRLKNKLRRAA